LAEIAEGRRKLFGHDPRAASPEAPNNQFLLVRDQMASGTYEHVLGIFTPQGVPQPSDIRAVRREDASHLGRMIRKLLFADRASAIAPKGGFPSWGLSVNVPGAVPVLHIHASQSVASSASVTDWNAYARENKYELVKSSPNHSVWVWK